MSKVAKAFVSEVLAQELLVKVMDARIGGMLLDLGFQAAPEKGKEVLSIGFLCQEDKVKLFSKLRDEGVCFSIGPGWCPAEIFELMRDQGLLTGFYQKIVWSGPGLSEIIENC